MEKIELNEKKNKELLEKLYNKEYKRCNDITIINVNKGIPLTIFYIHEYMANCPDYNPINAAVYIYEKMDAELFTSHINYIPPCTLHIFCNTLKSKKVINNYKIDNPKKLSRIIKKSKKIDKLLYVW
jgi:hypothetical protein